VHVESNGRPTRNASVEIYNEDDSIAPGDESMFTDTEKSTIFEDVGMDTEAGNPGVTADDGDFVFHIPVMSRMAVKVSTSLTGSKWYRYNEATGTDPL